MKQKRESILIKFDIFIGIFLIIAACNKATEPTPVSIPILTTSSVSGITQTSALSGGNITSDGGSAISNRGVCWSTNSTPTVSDYKTTDGKGTGIFSSAITGLSANTSYSLRSYATNSAGTAYGNLVSFSTSSTSNQIEYLGQTPPGKGLKPFASNIIPQDIHGTVTISPDKQEIYWASRRAIMVTKLINGIWQTPEVVNFSGKGTIDFYDDVPIITPDNKKLFFISRRPLNPYPSNKENIWYCERTSSGWSEPQALASLINSIQQIHWQISISNSGTLYFSGSPDGLSRIFYSRFVNGVYTTPEIFPVINNDVGLNPLISVTCPSIAPDESYIIFGKSTFGIGSIHISFKSKEGQWLPPVRIQELTGSRVGAFVSYDGKYLFSHNDWISAEILEYYKPR